jgi:hypothetical protein
VYAHAYAYAYAHAYVYVYVHMPKSEEGEIRPTSMYVYTCPNQMEA